MEEKRKVGRPKGAKFDSSYRLRMSSEDHEKLKSISKTIGVPVSDILRTLVSDYVSSFETHTEFDKLKNFKNLSFRTKFEAEGVLNELKDLLHRVGHVFVSDFYDISGYMRTNTSSCLWWTNLDGSQVTQCPDGAWKITFPEPEWIWRS